MSPPRTNDDAAPLVSVVIVNFNGRSHLERCLPSLADTTGAPFETIVVDNGSGDGSVGWLGERFADVRVLALGANLGFGEANRRGAEAARGEYIAFLNNDTVVTPTWLAAMIWAIGSGPEIAAVCATLRLLDHPELLNARGGGMTWLGYGYDPDLGVPYDPPDVPGTVVDTIFPTAAAMLIRRDEFLACGGFDPAFFMYHEDVDLGWRLWLLGRRVVVAPDAVVFHAWGGTTRSAAGMAWKERLGARHNLRTLIKHYEPYNMARALKNLVKLWVRARAWGRMTHVFAWNLWHLPGTLAWRRRLQRARKVTDRELFDRGLIADAPVPPPAPEVPVGTVELDHADWIPTPLLLPGYHSGLGRLGHGWYARTTTPGGRWFRWTAPRALCHLKVEPGSSGELAVELMRPAAAGGAEAVTVSCNGESHTVAVARDAWCEVRTPARADALGLLAVEISCDEWVPHRVRADWDFRRLGCAVRQVRFVASPASPPRSYRSVSVVLPTYNRWPILAETLDALAAQSWPALQVIVVDDGSTDGTFERLQAWRNAHAGRLDLTVLHQANLKPGRARNHGLHHATGDLVVFLGDDTVPAADFVERHVARHNAIGDTVAVLGFTDWHRARMHVTPFLELVNLDGQQFSYGHFEDGEDLFFTCFYTSNISLPRWVLGDDPFHPAFTFVDWEDTEVGYRLSRRGLRIVLDRAPVAHHVHPMTLSSFYRRQEHVGRTVEVLLALHRELASNDAMPPLEPRGWHAVSRLLVPPLVPLLSAVDRLGVRLPKRLYRFVLLSAFFTGRRQGFARHVAMSGAGA